MAGPSRICRIPLLSFCCLTVIGGSFGGSFYSYILGLRLAPNITGFSLHSALMLLLTTNHIFGNSPWLSPHLTEFERGSRSEFMELGHVTQSGENKALYKHGNLQCPYGNCRSSSFGLRQKCLVLLLVLQKYPASHPGLCGAAPFPQRQQRSGN